MIYNIYFQIFSKFKNIILYSVSSISQSALVFLLLPSILGYLSPEDFGKYTIIQLFVSVFSGVFYMGATTSLLKHYFDTVDKEKRKIIFSANLVITIIGALLITIIGIFFGNQILSLIVREQFDWLLLVVAFASAGMQIIFNYFLTFLRCLEKSIIYLYFSLGLLIINFIFTLFLFNIATIQYIIVPFFGTFVSVALANIILFIYLKQELTHRIPLQIFVKNLKFGFPFALSGIVLYLGNSIDRFVLSSLMNEESVGVYSFAIRMGAIIQVLLIIPFGLFWSSVRLDKFNGNSFPMINSKIAYYYIFIGFVLILFLNIFSDQVIGFFTDKDQYSQTSNLILVFMIAYLIQGFQNISDIGIFRSGKNIYLTLLSVLLIPFFIISNRLLIPSFGLYGAAFTLLFGYVIFAILIIYINNRFVSLPYDLEGIAKLLIYNIVILLVFNIYMKTYEGIFLRLFFAIGYLSILTLFFIKKDDKLFIKPILNKL
jgi:O-antigen/teichoic acid export membrane protein